MRNQAGSREVWGHAPPENTSQLEALRSLLRVFVTKTVVQYAVVTVVLYSATEQDIHCMWCCDYTYYYTREAGLCTCVQKAWAIATPCGHSGSVSKIAPAFRMMDQYFVQEYKFELNL